MLSAMVSQTSSTLEALIPAGLLVDEKRKQPELCSLSPCVCMSVLARFLSSTFRSYLPLNWKCILFKAAELRCSFFEAVLVLSF